MVLGIDPSNRSISRGDAISGIRMILLDIEGTTSSIRFVYDVMFPYVREHLATFLQEHWEAASVQESLDLLAEEAGHDSAHDWLGKLEPARQRQTVHNFVISLMDRDVKSTGLKQLQGLIWEAGFTSGELVAHVYDDVLPALERWSDLGYDVRVYSSGSVKAQELFFGHTVVGNILPYFYRHYDTTLGPKTDPLSYQAIASDFGRPSHRVLFVSDTPAELEAADKAGMHVALSLRPGNKPVDGDGQYRSITSFYHIDELFRLN